jgi:hypothetical protein
MAVLRPVVQSFVRAVLGSREYLPECGGIAGQLVGHDYPWLGMLPLHQPAQKRRSRLLVASLLEDHIEHHAVRVHCSPQVVGPASDPQVHLVQMPVIAGMGPASAHLQRKEMPTLEAPAPDRLVRHDDAAHRQQLLNRPIAERETEVQVDRVANDRGREAMAAV